MLSDCWRIKHCLMGAVVLLSPKPQQLCYQAEQLGSCSGCQEANSDMGTPSRTTALTKTKLPSRGAREGIHTPIST